MIKLLENKKRVEELIGAFSSGAFSSPYQHTTGATSHRYRSWEFCREAFLKERGKNNADKEQLALHLAFYLASWGMYRGSSFLLQLDYKAHIGAVEIMLDAKYDQLFDSDKLILDYKQDRNNCQYLNLLFGLGGKPGIKQDLAVYYDAWRKKVNNDEAKNDLSDVLVTKVLMGVFGCVPAYDRFFVDGLKSQGYNAQFTKSGVKKLLEELVAPQKHYDLIVDQQAATNRQYRGEIYTFMKTVDMLFWQQGFGECVILDENERACPNGVTEINEENYYIKLMEALEGNISKNEYQYFVAGRGLFSCKCLSSLVMCLISNDIGQLKIARRNNYQYNDLKETAKTKAPFQNWTYWVKKER